MAVYLGIDTSNYTTSCAVYDSESGAAVSKRKLLPVKSGEIGIRQSDAVFHHTVQLPELMSELFDEYCGKPEFVCVSEKPRPIDGSYMPCFLAGVSAAKAVSAAFSLPLYRVSHQEGHIAAALYSIGRLDLFQNDFIAFHVSGGTTEALWVKKAENDSPLKIELIGQSLDLKAGQAVDRVGAMLSLSFPAGKAMDALSLESQKEFKVRPCLKGCDCSLSGVQNQCEKMLRESAAGEDIAKYCLTFIGKTILGMCSETKKNYAGLPIVFAGGVMSNTLIRNMIQQELGADVFFALPELSCDNAVGTAVLGEVLYGE